jgi:hypothetical protein
VAWPKFPQQPAALLFAVNSHAIYLHNHIMLVQSHLAGRPVVVYLDDFRTA